MLLQPPGVHARLEPALVMRLESELSEGLQGTKMLTLFVASAAFHTPTLRTQCVVPQLRVSTPPVALFGLFKPEPTAPPEPVLVRGVGEGRDLPSPSGINELPELQQAGVVLAILVAIGAGSSILAGPVFDAVRGSSLWDLSFPTWPILGIIYLAAGVAHFTEAEGFENITPPNGTWGLFYTPFSPRTNVLWTGVVEIFGGAWMLFGAAAGAAGVALPGALGPVVSDGALTLYLLTWIVTPANIYALTHGGAFINPS